MAQEPMLRGSLQKFDDVMAIRGRRFAELMVDRALLRRTIFTDARASG